MNTRPKAYESSALPLSYPAISLTATRAAGEESIHAVVSFGKSKINFFLILFSGSLFGLFAHALQTLQNSSRVSGYGIQTL